MSDWMYLLNGQTLGPVSDKKIVDMLTKLVLDFDSNIMSSKDGLWKKIRDVKPIMDQFNTPAITMNCSPLPGTDLDSFKAVDISHNIYFYIPIKRLILMTILTCGVYQLYWWYKQWSYWAYKRKQVRSFDREAGWFLFELMVLEKIQIDEELNRVERSDFNGRALFTGWMLVGVLIWLAFTFFNTNIYLYLLMCGIAFTWNTLFLLPPQKYINRVNAKLGNQYEAPGFGHYLCLGFGILAWIFEIYNIVLIFVK